MLWEIKERFQLATSYCSTISSLLHLVGLLARVYYTLTNCGGGGGARPPWPPLNTPMKHSCYYLKELVKSAIIPIFKDKSVSLSKSTNYRGISLFNNIWCRGKVSAL